MIGQYDEISYADSYVAITNPDVPPVGNIDRFAFYDRAKKAFAVVMTGETAKHGNILLNIRCNPLKLK